MSYRFLLFLAFALTVVLSVRARPREIWERYNIALIGDDRGGARFSAISSGARHAAETISQMRNLEIRVDTGIAANWSLPEQVGGQAVPDGVLLHGGTVAMTVPVVEVLYDWSEVDSLGVVVPDNRRTGRLAAEALVDRLGENEREVAIFAGDLSLPGIADRVDAAKAFLNSQPQLKLVEVASATGGAAGLRLALEQLCHRNDANGFDGLLVLDDVALIAWEVLPWDAWSVTCVAVGGQPAVFKHLRSQRVSAIVTIDYFDLGYRAAVRLMDEVHPGRPARGGFERIPELVTLANLDEAERLWLDWLSE